MAILREASGAKDEANEEIQIDTWYTRKDGYNRKMGFGSKVASSLLSIETQETSKSVCDM